VIKGRTVGHGGRTMTYRVWPLWMRVLQIVLGLGLVFAAVIGARRLDVSDLRLPFDLGSSGEDDAPDDEERAAGWTARPDQIPVLMYRLAGDPESGVPDPNAVSPERFAEHLTYLRDQDYTTVTAAEYLAALDGAALPDRPVLLTIDGPAAKAQEFVRALERYGMVATFFVASAATEPGAADAVRRLLAVGEVGGQSDVPLLAAVSAEEQRAAIAASRSWLDELSDKPVIAFAYPAGNYDEHTVPAVEAAGYRVAFDAWGGLAAVTNPATNRWHLHRIAVDPNASLDDLTAALAGR